MCQEQEERRESMGSVYRRKWRCQGRDCHNCSVQCGKAPEDQNAERDLLISPVLPAKTKTQNLQFGRSMTQGRLFWGVLGQAFTESSEWEDSGKSVHFLWLFKRLRPPSEVIDLDCFV